MQVGVPKETKDRENRVALTPDGAAALVRAGHRVLVEQGAGLGSGFSDEHFRAAGAETVHRESAWNSGLVVKVKEPQPGEYPYLAAQILFTYLHLSGSPAALTAALLRAGTTAVAYETVEDAQGRLPLLAPMSAVAGNMAATMGAYYLARFNQGKGVLLGQVLGRAHGKVLVVGDGVVGRHAARSAAGMGAQVFLCGRHPERAPELKRSISPDLQFVASTPEHIGGHVQDADLVVGGVLRRGARAPHVVSEAMVSRMQPGSVIVDVSIDQGGCVETSRPTSHSEPVYLSHGVIHYCVTNMPGAYPRTSTLALTDATLGHVLRLAGDGVAALRRDAGFARGVNVHRGRITCEAVARDLDMGEDYRAFSSLPA